MKDDLTTLIEEILTEGIPVGSESSAKIESVKVKSNRRSGSTGYAVYAKAVAGKGSGMDIDICRMNSKTMALTVAKALSLLLVGKTVKQMRSME